jgi:hypothetical protein
VHLCSVVGAACTQALGAAAALTLCVMHVAVFFEHARVHCAWFRSMICQAFVVCNLHVVHLWRYASCIQPATRSHTMVWCVHMLVPGVACVLLLPLCDCSCGQACLPSVLGAFGPCVTRDVINVAPQRLFDSWLLHNLTVSQCYAICAGCATGGAAAAATSCA